MKVLTVAAGSRDNISENFQALGSQVYALSLSFQRTFTVVGEIPWVHYKKLDMAVSSKGAEMTVQPVTVGTLYYKTLPLTKVLIPVA